MSVKSQENNMRRLAELLSRQGLFSTSFSKYGVCYLRHLSPNLRKKEVSAYAQ